MQESCTQNVQPMAFSFKSRQQNINFFRATLLKVIYGRWIEDHSATSKFHILLSVTLYTWQNVRYDELPFWSVQVSSRESVSGINISHHKIFALHWTFFTPSNSIETKKYPSMKKKKKKKKAKKNIWDFKQSSEDKKKYVELILHCLENYKMPLVG